MKINEEVYHRKETSSGRFFFRFSMKETLELYQIWLVVGPPL